MRLTDKIGKGGIYILALSLALGSFSCIYNQERDNETKKAEQSAITGDVPSGYIPNKSNYSKIEWILHKEGKRVTYGEQPDNKKLPEKLEEIVFTETDPKDIQLSEWEITSLARLVPLKKMIEKHANYYSISPIWATMFLNFESTLNPSDYNKLSNDFGLGQIKRESEKLAKESGTNPENEVYSPYLNKEKTIFDPETNIIMAMLLHRHNIDKYNLKNSDQVYAIYVRGELGLNDDGTLSDLTKDKLKGIHDRFISYKNIIPLFRLEKRELNSIQNKDTKRLLEIYHNNNDAKVMYQEELKYFLNDLEKNIKGDARSVLVYDDCVTFAKTLDLVWSIDQSENYKRISGIGKKLSELVTEKDLKERVERTSSILLDAQNISKEK